MLRAISTLKYKSSCCTYANQFSHLPRCLHKLRVSSLQSDGIKGHVYMVLAAQLASVQYLRSEFAAAGFIPSRRPHGLRLCFLTNSLLIIL